MWQMLVGFSEVNGDEWLRVFGSFVQAGESAVDRVAETE